MELTRHERRLLEIQYKISVLGHRKAFNLAVRRDALAKLEILLTDQVAEERLMAGHGA